MRYPSVFYFNSHLVFYLKFYAIFHSATISASISLCRVKAVMDINVAVLGANTWGTRTISVINQQDSMT